MMGKRPGPDGPDHLTEPDEIALSDAATAFSRRTSQCAGTPPGQGTKEGLPTVQGRGWSWQRPSASTASDMYR